MAFSTLYRTTNSLQTAASRRMTSSQHFSSSSSSLLDRMQTMLFGGADVEVDPGQVAGTDLRIVKYPHPSLRKHNEEINPQDLKKGSESAQEITQIAKEMFLVMYAAQGVGLAAPQVGINKRLLVYNQSGDPKKWLDEVVLINPHIIEMSDAKTIETEGCLSFPDMDGKVERSKWIKVEALNLKGKKIKRKFTDWEARIFQHEYDHLDGTVYVDRLIDDEEKATVQPRLDELVQDYKDGDFEEEAAL